MTAGPVPDSPLFWGLKIYEWLTLLGIILGPIIAVLITLWIEGRRRNRDQQVQLMRMLVSTRHLPGDPAYTLAINTIPIEFNHCSRVMNAWKNYIDVVRYQPSSDNADAHLKDTFAKQTKLLFEIMKELGFQLAETDIQNSAYAAGGFIERDNLMLNAWRSWPRIAEALEFQNKMLAHTPTIESTEADH